MSSILFDEGTFEFSSEEILKLQDLRKLVEGSFFFLNIKNLQKTILKDCPELEIGTDDNFLSRWLYFNEWNVKGAFESINKYYDFKAQNSQWFAKIDNIEQMKELITKVEPRIVLKRRDVQGRIIIVNKLSKCLHIIKYLII